MEKLIVYGIKIIIFITAMFFSGKALIAFFEKRGKNFKFFDVQILFAASIISVIITKIIMVILKKFLS